MTGGIFAVLDDIAMLMDDAAIMSKVAAKKTAGLLGDDLAVNAEKATGFRAARELPVLWAITKGSFINKLILLPVAFLLSAYAPWMIVPILLLGGSYLSYEGIEKIYHTLFKRGEHKKHAADQPKSEKELLKIEKNKIKSAVRTDFILSIEIVMISLGTVMEESLMLQIMVVSFVAILATVGVYGLVAMLVRMDDVGFFLIEQAKDMKKWLAQIVSWSGAMLVAALPKIIRGLGAIGTIAMLLVGGGMFTHNIEALHHALEFMNTHIADFLVGSVVGAVLLALHLLVNKMRALTLKAGAR